MPSPGPETVHYGGNTSCLEVVCRTGERLIFDAGSGIRRLGEKLGRAGGTVQADLFLTHFHWDHIQGLPFFGPLYDPAARVCIHGPTQGGLDVQTLVAGQMGSVYFPVPFEALEAHVSFHHIDGTPFESGGVRVTAHRLRHPNDTYGYRLDGAGASIAYVPDNELVGGNYKVAAGWYESLRDFLSGVDLLFHDAMFTDAEYPRFEGWGHSSVSQAIRLAEDAGVRRLSLFHHSPGRSDADLTRILDHARDDVARRGSALELEVATEGEELMVEVSQ